MRITGLALAAAMLVPVAAAYAQESRDATVYKVDFTMHDSADTVAKNGRKYSMTVAPRVKSVMKVGNRVPSVTGGSGAMPQNMQYTYIDVGVNIDFVMDERQGKYVMHADLDMSTAIPAEKTSGLPNPTISQIKVAIDTAVMPGKPTVVASFDDPSTTRKFDVDVTITKM